jgi:twitching motility two-component system response regulator PilH
MERILIADDNDGARALLTSVLESRGYRVTVTSDGFEALEQLQESLPDLMLLDIQMPRMDGCEVCRVVKNRPDTRGIPVVLVSGLADAAELASEAGADGFVHKPFSLDTLLTEVRRQLPVPVAVASEAGKASHGGWLSRLDCARLCLAAT